MTKKHFRAISKTDPEDVVDFDLGDIYSYDYGKENHCLGNIVIDTARNEPGIFLKLYKWSMSDWLKDYTLYHLEQGEYVLHRQQADNLGGGDE